MSLLLVYVYIPHVFVGCIYVLYIHNIFKCVCTYILDNIIVVYVHVHEECAYWNWNSHRHCVCGLLLHAMHKYAIVMFSNCIY